ncbi:MAG: exodeoxyribonuclease VII large subunit [Bdellovibrionaceae bacterium]|nr:exodeoxyribonuclease VII large subunit [Pseudobdellovibrionaceae bacterium]
MSQLSFEDAQSAEDTENLKSDKDTKNAQSGKDAENQTNSAQKPTAFSVSSLNAYIRSLLEGDLPNLYIKGEISNFVAHSSGHYYFSLKDSKSQIRVVMFRGYNSKLKFKPKDGMEVLVKAKLSVYEPRGTYQLFCEHMEPQGLGALQLAFEQLKNQLRSEGLFLQENKKPLPPYPQHVVLITSPTGAALQDMLNVLQRRARNIKVTLIPALVQGEKAPASLLKAFKQITFLKNVDVIIMGRGGGSLEDLWAFNDEALARAVFASSIPVISAVGHEIDFSILDFVSDLRAPTPSAAAELVVKNSLELLEKINFLKLQLIKSFQSTLQRKKEKLLQLEAKVINPQTALQQASLRCDELRHRLDLLIKNTLQKQKQKINTFNAVLDSLSPLKVVSRGYSLLTDEQGSLVKKTSQVKKGDLLLAQLSDAHLQVEVKKIIKTNEKKQVNKTSK